MECYITEITISNFGKQFTKPSQLFFKKHPTSLGKFL